jgi:hypothetical protein
MPTMTIEYATEAERVDLERVLAYVAEMRRVGATAAPGTVLSACESYALGAGRAVLRENLAAAVQGRADAEKKSRGRGRRGVGPGS